MPRRSAYLMATSNLLLTAAFALQAVSAHDRLHACLYAGSAVAIGITGATFLWVAVRTRTAT
jgi:hypothetical protein